MNKTTWPKRIEIIAIATLAAISSAVPAAAQFIDTGTPTPAQEASPAGGWDTLLPGRPGEEGTSSITGDTYVLPSSGVEVIIADGVTTDLAAGGEVEDQIIVETDAGLGAVAVLSSRGQPISLLESYVGGFGGSMEAVVEIEVESTRDTATGIYRVESEGTMLYLYISVDARAVSGHMVIEVIVADAADVESAIVQMRENVSINGIPAFANTDEQDVADVILKDGG